MQIYIEKIKNSLKKFFSHWYIKGISIALTAGVILIQVTKSCNKDDVNNLKANLKKKTEQVYKPLFTLANYKILPKNEEYAMLDTLELNYQFRGVDVIMRTDFEIVDYNFQSDIYFHTGNYNQFKPEIKFVEEIIENPIIDENNKSGKIYLEIKRKMIFDGINSFDFKSNDKKIIGFIRLKFSYQLNDQIINDTIESKIFLVK